MLIKIVASAINVTRTVHRFLISLLSDPPFADVSAVTVIDERFLHGKHRENEGSQFSPSATLREALRLSIMDHSTLSARDRVCVGKCEAPRANNDAANIE